MLGETKLRLAKKPTTQLDKSVYEDKENVHMSNLKRSC